MHIEPSRAPSLVAALAGLEHDLDALLATDAVVAAQEADVADAAVALARVRAKVASLDAAVVRRFASSGVWAAEGARNPKSWLRSRTRAGFGEVAQRARVADQCGRFPHLAERLAQGLVSPEHLRALADAHAYVPALSPALAAAEPAIADYAATHTPLELRRFLSRLLIRVDAGAVDDADARKLQERAGIDVSTLMDGWVHLAATLPPDIGATFLACIESAGIAVRRATKQSTGQTSTGQSAAGDSSNGSATTEQSTTDQTSAGEATADDVAPGSDTANLICDPRPRRARNLDAFARLLAAAEAALGDPRLPDLRGSRPVVQITVTPAELARLAEQAEIDADQLVLDGAPTATLTGASGGRGIALGPESARRIACDAAVRRLVADPGGAVLDVGRTTRVISPAQRVAVTHRDQGCRWPGCESPIDEVHHIVHWAHGGRTDLSNLLGVCWWHHHVLHEQRWRITGHPEHRLEFQPPDPLAGSRSVAA